jgi:hypothetical protein
MSHIIIKQIMHHHVAMQLIDICSSMHHINDPYLSNGLHFDIYHSHQGLCMISMIHLYQLVSTFTSIILIKDYAYSLHQSSINQSLDIN